MRNLIIILFVSFASLNSFGQDLNKYFAQGKLNSSDQTLIKTVQEEIKNKAGIWMVRIDPTNGNVLEFTTELPNWTEEEFISLFGSYSNLLSCPFVGVFVKITSELSLLRIVNDKAFSACLRYNY